MYDNISKVLISKVTKSALLVRVLEWRGIGNDCPAYYSVLAGAATEFQPGGGTRFLGTKYYEKNRPPLSNFRPAPLTKFCHTYCS